MTIQPNPAIMDRALDMPGGCDPCQAGCDNITLRGHAAICCICRGVDEDYCGTCERRYEERGTEAFADEQPFNWRMILAKQEASIFLDQDEAAELLRLSPRTLEKLRVSGEGPPFLKFTSRVVYDRQDLIGWARSSRRASTSDSGGVQCRSVNSMSTTPEAIKRSAAFALGKLAETLDELAKTVEYECPYHPELLVLVGRAKAQRDDVSRAIKEEEIKRLR